jgi:hypothetical protein
MELIKEIVIANPPTKYNDKKKTKIDPKTGKLKVDVYYLTANLFYAGIPYFMRVKITDAIKSFLMPYLNEIPKMSKMRVELIYRKQQDTFDLDNKGFFWLKMFLDIVKTPSNRQIQNAHKRNKEIKTINALKDDTVRYIDDIRLKYERGEHALIIRVFGKLDIPEKTLFDL